VAVHVSESVTLTARRHLHAWPAMEVLGRAAAGHLGRPLREVTVADLYSCFPSAVRVQQRALGLDPDGTPTVTGGMAFAGGPFNNYVLQSTAAVARLLRHDPGQLGLVTTVSGMLSKPGLAVWSATAPDHARGLLIGDLASEALAATPTLPVAAADHAPGPATVVAATVTFGGSDPLAPTRTAVVADLPDGQRTVATCEDAAISLNALTESLIGHTVQVDGVAFRP
jgi:acetyl-CoA C-acetyltransferase